MNGLKTGWRWGAVLAALLILAPVAQGEDGLSKANRLLFQTDHLKDLEGSPTLVYRLKRAGTEGEPFTDRIQVHLKRNSDGKTFKADISYLTGKRERHVPSVPKASGNPILKVFLQREVLEIQDETGGNWRYFQKAFKKALSNEARVETVTFDYRGQTVEGKRVHVVPYREDAYSDRMGEYSAAEYDLVLSEAVPGGVYRLVARVPARPGVDASDPDNTLFTETLTLEEVRMDGKG